jgi:hypothetical protein
MPRDIETKISNQPRALKKARIIVGMLGEIDAADVLIIFASKEAGSSFAAKISTEFKVPFEESKVRVRDHIAVAGRYAASALFAGQRVTFELDVLDADGNCSLPAEIAIHDLRQSKRRRFGPEIQFAEISTEQGILMASPLDMSQHSIALRIHSRDARLNKGEVVRLVIRGDTAGRDIYCSEMIVQKFSHESGQAKVLLEPSRSQALFDSGKHRGVGRSAISGFALDLSPMDDSLGEPIQFALCDVSMTGFSGQSQMAQNASWVAPGMSVRVLKSVLTATIVWREADKFGFRIDSLDDAQALGEWARLLASLTKENEYHHSQVEELVALFTESGLLKGKRRHLYGSTPGGYLPPDRMTENPLLFRRITQKSDGHKHEGHLSLVRLADDIWYAQEGAYVGSDKNGYRALVTTTILLSRDILRSTRSAPRYLAGLFSGDLASASAAYSTEFFSDPTCRVYSLYQAGIHGLLDRAGQDVADQVISDIFELSADSRVASFSRFDSTLAESFGGWNGRHPRLNAELAKFGPHHEGRTLFISDKTNGVWGMAYRLKSYYALSVSGVMNSVFLIVRPDVTVEAIAQGLRALTDAGFCFGTDDVAIIVDPGKASSPAFSAEALRAKPFTLFILDNHLHREYLGGQIEDADGIKKRVKKS